MKKRKVTWRVGRKGICNTEKAIKVTYQICPEVHKGLNVYCSLNGYLRSIIVNEAIKAYLKNNQDIDDVAI